MHFHLRPEGDGSSAVSGGNDELEFGGRNMQTIIVLLNPGMLENADLDLRYRIPDRIEEVSNSLIQSNGYNYIDTEDGEPGPLMLSLIHI